MSSHHSLIQPSSPENLTSHTTRSPNNSLQIIHNIFQAPNRRQDIPRERKNSTTHLLACRSRDPASSCTQVQAPLASLSNWLHVQDGTEYCVNFDGDTAYIASCINAAGE